MGVWSLGQEADEDLKNSSQVVAFEVNTNVQDILIALVNFFRINAFGFALM